SRRDFLRGSLLIATASAAAAATPGKASAAGHTVASVPHPKHVLETTKVLAGDTAAVAAGGAANEALSGFLAGAASRISKEILLHPLDTVKARLQFREGSRKVTPELFRDLYTGLLPPVVAGAPAGAVFFSVKDYVKAAAGSGLGFSTQQATLLAVLAAQFPYWLIRSPSELIKTRRQTGLESGAVQALKDVYAEEGLRGVYTGYASNIAYAYPTDVIKFLLYDSFKQQYKAATGKKLTPLEAAAAGSLSSAAAQVVSTPLDVARTRVLTRKLREEEGGEGGGEGAADNNILQELNSIREKEGAAGLFAGIVPRVIRSGASGAIQFGTYETVKGLFGEEAAKSFKK
ncbi:unnamed protein product, partial [Heterosigma akashiwo]